MAYVDLGILIVICLFVGMGFFFGFLHSIGSIIGTIASFILANRFIDPIFQYVGPIFGNSTISRIIIYILTYVIFTRLISVVFWLLGKVFRIVSWIPFAKTIDRLLGAVFGLIEGLIVVGVILLFSMNVVPKETLSSLLATSVFAKYFVSILSLLMYFLPSSVKQLIETATKLIQTSFPK